MLTIIPTIDVEGVHGDDPFNQMILGRIGDKNDWGALRLAEIFNNYNITGTFFIDVYEHKLWGENPFKDLCNNLLDLGQDVQLHTHPGWRIDPRDSRDLQEYKAKNSYFHSSKDLNSKLTLKEQINLFEQGSELLHKWTKVLPIAHRSGGYSINSDTVSALKQVGIKMDSSMYFSHENSLETWSKNSIVVKDSIIELPVTVGLYKKSIKLLNSQLLLYRKYMKTDIDVFDLNEFEQFYSESKLSNIKFLNLFMHSYSLLNYSKDFSKFYPDIETFHKLEKVLAFFNSKEDIQVISMKEFYKQFVNAPNRFIGSDDVPQIELSTIKMLKYGLNKLNSFI
jgi:hypothetical protein